MPTCAVLGLTILAAGAVLSSAVSLRPVSDNCHCKNFKDSYKNEMVTCGAGREFIRTAAGAAGKDTPSTYKFDTDSAQENLCMNFFRKLNISTCVNMNMGRDEGSWCYVNAACESLNGGAAAFSSALSWKVCTTDDVQLRDYKPQELYNMSVDNDIYFGALLKMAYPGARAGESMIVSTEDFEHELPKKVSMLRDKHGVEDAPFFIDTNVHGTLPTIIIYLNSVYKVEKGANVDADHAGTWSQLTCVRDC